MKTPHEHAALIKAWADGAKIQFLYRGIWYSVKDPSWCHNDVYRIKPEPKPDRVAYWVHSCGDIEIYNTKQMLGTIYADQLKVVFDGETGAIKAVEIL